MRTTHIGLALVMALSLVFAATAPADSIYWSGDGTTNNWSDGDNWKDGSPPQAGDSPYFDNTLTSDVVINLDQDVTISTFYMLAGCTVNVTVDQGGKNDVDGGYHYLFDDQNTGASRASDGYELVIENGDVVRYQTDVLYRIPTELFKASLMADKERSDIMMRTEMTRAAQEAKAAGGSANVRVVQTGPDADKAAKTG